MNDQTLIIYYWKTPNPFNFQFVKAHDWEPELAMRLARILASGGGVIRSMVVHGWWDGERPMQERVDISHDGSETRREANYIRHPRGGWTIDPYEPWKELA